jgi:hypothetical protein
MHVDTQAAEVTKLTDHVNTQVTQIKQLMEQVRTLADGVERSEQNVAKMQKNVKYAIANAGANRQCRSQSFLNGEGPNAVSITSKPAKSRDHAKNWRILGQSSKFV